MALYHCVASADAKSDPNTEPRHHQHLNKKLYTKISAKEKT